MFDDLQIISARNNILIIMQKSAIWNKLILDTNEVGS